MAIDFCDLCNDPCISANIGAKNMENNWRLLVAQALCAIGNGGLTASPLPQALIGFGALSGTYADSGFLDAELKLKRLYIANTTDADIQVSLDGGATTHFTIIAGTARDLNIGSLLFAAQTDLQVRTAPTQTASLGSLYIEGGY